MLYTRDAQLLWGQVPKTRGLQGREREVRFWGGAVCPPYHQLIWGLGSAMGSPVGSANAFWCIWAWKSHLAATFYYLFQLKSGKGALWCILKYAYTSGVSNNWKLLKIPDSGMNWNRTIRSCHKYFFNVRLKRQTGQFFRSTVASHAGHRHGFHGRMLCTPALYDTTDTKGKVAIV